MKHALILIGVIGLALCGCQSETQRNPNLAIEATLKSYETALNASDTDAVLALYAEDGVFMPTEAPTAAGKEQIRAAYETSSAPSSSTSSSPSMRSSSTATSRSRVPSQGAK